MSNLTDKIKHSSANKKWIAGIIVAFLFGLFIKSDLGAGLQLLLYCTSEFIGFYMLGMILYYIMTLTGHISSGIYSGLNTIMHPYLKYFSKLGTVVGPIAGFLVLGILQKFLETIMF